MILNLQSADPELSKRLIDFASGLTYALDGGMQRVADKVFLLTPRNVEVSAEERARCSSAAASSTRRNRSCRTGEPNSRSCRNRRTRRDAANVLEPMLVFDADRLGRELPRRLHRRLHPLILAVHHHVLDPAAVLAG